MLLNFVEYKCLCYDIISPFWCRRGDGNGGVRARVYIKKSKKILRGKKKLAWLAFLGEKGEVERLKLDTIAESQRHISCRSSLTCGEDRREEIGIQRGDYFFLSFVFQWLVGSTNSNLSAQQERDIKNNLFPVFDFG